MDFMKGKGAQINVSNKFNQYHVSTEDPDGLDEEYMQHKPRTQVFYETPKKILSTNNSPDLSFSSSINPYQGCEHGCVYCYARNSHEYWGFGAGLDFETKIVVKEKAPDLLEKEFLKPNYTPRVIMLSGNTDCYQPLEQKYQITRALLRVFEKYQNPVSIITKNALVSRDVDILEELAQNELVSVIISITSLDENLRRLLEPRTASAVKKLKAIELLASRNIPIGIMNAPIIPGLNHYETPAILKAAASAGATFAGYTVVRLNGQIDKIFKDWLEKTFPEKAAKIKNQIRELHDGHLNDSDFGRRMRGEGKIASIIKDLFEVNRRKYFKENKAFTLSTAHFRKGGTYSLF